MNLKKNKVKLFNLIYILYKSLNNFIEKIEIKNNELIIYVNKNNLYIFNLFLKYHMKTQVKSLIDICTVDLLSLSDNNTTLKNRFEVVYSLISYKFNFRIRLKVFINNNELLYSLNKIYSSSL